MSTITITPIPQGTTSKDPSIVQSLLWIAGLVAFQFLGITIAVVLQMAVTGNTGEMLGSATTLMFGMLIGSGMLIALRAKYMLRHLAPAWDKNSPYALNAKGLALTVGVVIASAVFAYVYQSYVIAGREMQPELVIFLNAMNGGPIGVLMVYLVGAIAAPVLEEVLFRGQLQGSIQQKLEAKTEKAPIFAILISSAVFAAIHFQPLALPPLFVAGCAFGYVRWKTGSLALPMIAHILLNGFSITVLYFSGTL